MLQKPIHINALKKSWREYSHHIQEDIERGGKFKKYSYTISILVLTMKNEDIFYIPSECVNPKKAGIRNLISLTLGWWGFPWGPIYTFQSISTNNSGGKDVTVDVARIFKLQTRGQISREKFKQKLRSSTGNK
jgi:hypothetical protein